jgi:hypothetical protein
VIVGESTVIEPQRLDQVVSVRFNPETLILLREIAQRRGVLISDLLREGVRYIIAEERAVMARVISEHF